MCPGDTREYRDDLCQAIIDMNGSHAISLREIDASSCRAICKLDVADRQRGFVAPNAVSIAEAYFEKQAWFRGIYADDTPVGFAMLSVDEVEAEYYLWRFMLDHRYQGERVRARRIAAVDRPCPHTPERDGVPDLGGAG
jgi:hypothetical protein